MRLYFVFMSAEFLEKAELIVREVELWTVEQ
jgi:hypothetical protein